MAIAFSILANPAFAGGKFSAITVDARDGRILYSDSPDTLRHPASLTKVMTLYILFQELKSGRVKLSTPLQVSARAARMAPSKMGLKPGSTITVEQAIKALVIKSANDVAAVVGENLSGSEAAFATRMTKVARSIGMSRTVYRNASGLPNPSQVTTARDQATLALRTMRDFPQYYPYFRLQSFTFKGRTIRTHNRLVGRFEGTDGIKTGYTRASGYNLTTSTRRGDKRLVGVVLGSSSSGKRNAFMQQMLTRNFSKAKGGSTIAALAGSSRGAIDPLKTSPKDVAAYEAQDAVAPEDKSQLAAVTADVAATAPGQADEETPSLGELTEDIAEEADEEALPTDGSTQVLEARIGEGQPKQAPIVPFAYKSEEAEGDITGSTDAQWDIQIGAFKSNSSAQAKLKWLSQKGVKQLQGKEAFTVAVSKGSQTIYRARFRGFTEQTAKDTCSRLSRIGQNCEAVSPQS